MLRLLSSHKAKEAAWAKYEPGEMRGGGIALLRCDLNNIAIEEADLLPGIHWVQSLLDLLQRRKKSSFFTAMALDVS